MFDDVFDTLFEGDFAFAGEVINEWSNSQLVVRPDDPFALVSWWKSTGRTSNPFGNEYPGPIRVIISDRDQVKRCRSAGRVRVSVKAGNQNMKIVDATPIDEPEDPAVNPPAP